MAIALVQAVTAHGTAASTTLAVTVSALTTGNYIVVAYGGTSQVHDITPNSGTLSGIWMRVVNGTLCSSLSVARIATGGATTVTLFQPPSSAIAAVVAEFSAGGNLILDQAVQGLGTSTTATTGNCPTTTVANELWIGCNGCRNKTISSQLINGASPDNSYFDVTTYNAANTDRGIGLAYKIVSSTGTPTPGYSATQGAGSDLFASIFFALRQEAAAAAAGGGFFIQ